MAGLGAACLLRGSEIPLPLRDPEISDCLDSQVAVTGAGFWGKVDGKKRAQPGEPGIPYCLISHFSHQQVT